MLLLVLVSCEIEYDGETKLLVKGIIIDENNNPITNQDIKLFVSRASASVPFVFYLPSESNFIGKATTDSNGAYTMVIPKPKSNFSEILMLINEEQNQYNQKQLRNIKVEDFVNYELNLGIRKLYDLSNLVQLTVTLNQINATKQLIGIEYIGELANEIEYITPLETNDTYSELHKKVRKNQNLVIRYALRNYATNTNEIVEETIIIDASPTINYTLNY